MYAALASPTSFPAMLGLGQACPTQCAGNADWTGPAEQMLGANYAAYMALPAPRTVAQQQQFLSNFNTIWKSLLTFCKQAGTGTFSGGGSCSDLFSQYLYPIENDSVVATAPAVSPPATAPDSTMLLTTQAAPIAPSGDAGSSEMASGSGSLSSSAAWLLLAAAVIAVLVVLS